MLQVMIPILKYLLQTLHLSKNLIITKPKHFIHHPLFILFLIHLINHPIIPILLLLVFIIKIIESNLLIMDLLKLLQQ